MSFGDHVRAVARDRGLAQSRATLQQLGEQLAEQDPKRFCEDVIAQSDAEPDSPIIIDGIRHVPILERLRVLASLSPASWPSFRRMIRSAIRAWQSKRHINSQPLKLIPQKYRYLRHC